MEMRHDDQKAWAVLHATSSRSHRCRRHLGIGPLPLVLQLRGEFDDDILKSGEQFVLYLLGSHTHGDAHQLNKQFPDFVLSVQRHHVHVVHDELLYLSLILLILVFQILRVVDHHYQQEQHKRDDVHHKHRDIHHQHIDIHIEYRGIHY